MHRKNFRGGCKTPDRIYFLACAFIFGWWWFFQPQDQPTILFSCSENVYNIENAPYLEPICREDLAIALRGDFNWMVDLLIQWDHESLLMGSPFRLSSDEFREAILLLKTLNGSKELRIIPQTHVTATILLAIAPQIVQAIPMGLRGGNDLFSKASFNQVPLNCQELEGEIVHKMEPHLAFVAPYSNPTFLKMLRNQQVPEVHTQQISTLEDLYQTISKVAHLSKHPSEGRLLTLFMQGAIMAIDNRLLALEKHLKKDLPKVLYLTGEKALFSPTKESLTSNLLQRLGIETFEKEFSLEEIELFSPDTLILASHSTPRFKSKNIYQVNPVVQESPTQFAVLAYRDIVSCLMDRLLHE